MLELIYSGIIINFEEVLNICDVTKEQIGIKLLDENQHLITYILQNRNSITRHIPGFSSDTLHYYSYLKANIVQEDSKKKLVTLYELKAFLTLDEGSHFGDMALDSKTTRNATIRTRTETSLLYIDANLYEENLAKESIGEIEKRLAALLGEELCVDDEDINVSLEYTHDGEKLIFESARIFLSGGAIFKDPRDAKEYVEKILNCKCEVIYGKEDI